MTDEEQAFVDPELHLMNLKVLFGVLQRKEDSYQWPAVQKLLEDEKKAP